MAKKTFISSRYSDKEIVNTIKSRFQNNGGDIQGKAKFVEQDLSGHGGYVIDKEIRNVMHDCDAVLFVIGEDNHNSPWVKREAELAISMAKNIVVARLPKTFSGLPSELNRCKIYDWNDLAFTLNRL